MKKTELQKLIREQIRKQLNEAYRDPADNLDVLITLLKKNKTKEALELVEAVKEGLKYDKLEIAFDEAVENALDDGLGRALGNATMRSKE